MTPDGLGLPRQHHSDSGYLPRSTSVISSIKPELPIITVSTHTATMQFSLEKLKEAAAKVPSSKRGPGGALAVLKDGEVVHQHTWGYANMETREKIEPDTIFPICSISKQMLVATILSMARKEPDLLERMSKELEKLAPGLAKQKELTIPHLWNMQSGIRCYWALTVLWGASVGDKFLIERDGPEAIKRLGKLHFEPGTEYSYSNVNFYLLEHALQNATGKRFKDLARGYLFDPAGMKTAAVRPDTSRLPPPIVGYEGNVSVGWYPAPNGIHWSGDAGITASLEDMIAYEKHLDRSFTDADSVYRAMLQPQQFTDGGRSNYQHGLFWQEEDGISAYGHSGGLRGFTLFRVHVPDQRMSVVCLFNSHADSMDAGLSIIKGAFSIEEKKDPVVEPAAEWEGAYMDTKNNIRIVVSKGEPGKLKIQYAGDAGEGVTLKEPNYAENPSTKVRLEDGSLIIDRKTDHTQLHAKKIPKATTAHTEQDLAGHYRSEDVDSSLEIMGEDGMFYAAFTGYMGKGAIHVMRNVAQDLWAIECPRALDRGAPGDWTVVVHRKGDRIDSLTVGCWLARNIPFQRQD